MPRKTAAMPASGHSDVPTLIAYYRVSTERQGVSGLGLDAQRAAVAEYMTRSGGVLIHEFEEAESGKKANRPQLAAALAACRQHKARLVVAKLDRLARNTAFLLSVADGAGEAGVVFCDLPQLPPGPMGKFFLTLMAAVAELEAGLISQRTKAALAAAKARGKRLGNPHLLTHGAGPARKRQARAKAREILPFLRAAEKAGCKTLQEKADALTARGVKTPNGGNTWAPEQVRRIEKAAATLG